MAGVNGTGKVHSNTDQEGQRGSSLTAIQRWMVNATNRPLYPREKQLYRRLGGPAVPVWTSVENLAPTGIRFPDRQASSALPYRPTSYWCIWKKRVRYSLQNNIKRDLKGKDVMLENETWRIKSQWIGTVRTITNLLSKCNQTIFSISFIKYASYWMMRNEMTQSTQILRDTTKIRRRMGDRHLNKANSDTL